MSSCLARIITLCCNEPAWFYARLRKCAPNGKVPLVDSLAPTQDNPAQAQERPAQAQERLDGIYGRLNKIVDRIGAETRARLCEIPESPERIGQIWDCLMWRYYAPPKDSVAELASLHAFVNGHRDEHPNVARCLDGMVDRARRLNDAGWLRKYAQAIECASTGATHKLDLTARSLVEWRQLYDSLGRPPLPKELIERVEKETGIKYTRRQWRRVFRDLARLFEQSK